VVVWGRGRAASRFPRSGLELGIIPLPAGWGIRPLGATAEVAEGRREEGGKTVPVVPVVLLFGFFRFLRLYRFLCDLGVLCGGKRSSQSSVVGSQSSVESPCKSVRSVSQAW